jgi:hypothetical protein
MKYVMMIVSRGDSSMKLPVIFPDAVSHIEMAKATKQAIRNEDVKANTPFRKVEVVSAGFVKVSGICHGRSETLDMDSRGEDTGIINTIDYFPAL